MSWGFTVDVEGGRLWQLHELGPEGDAVSFGHVHGDQAQHAVKSSELSYRSIRRSYANAFSAPTAKRFISGSFALVFGGQLSTPKHFHAW